jgi:hypothetical protein
MEQQECNKKYVHISATEKRISKFILYIMSIFLLSGGLSYFYPTRSLLMDCIVMLYLGIGGVVAIAMATRDAVCGAKKVIEVSRKYSGKLNVSFTRYKKSMPQIFSGRRYICRARTNARSYHSAARPAFAHAADDGGGGTESDSPGDPPEPLTHAIQSQNLNHKLHSNLFQWRYPHVLDYRSMLCFEAAQKAVTI